ncbi:hypothetical protein IID23_04160 [Patescibacteria group bacterium]|nr:hypothetical protein [Patescibacteria group bacterium]
MIPAQMPGGQLPGQKKQNPTTQNAQEKKVNFPTPLPFNPTGIQSSNPYVNQRANRNGPVKESIGDLNKNKRSVLDQQDYKDILYEIGRVVLMMQIYKPSHPIVSEKLSKLSLLMIKVANKSGRIVLSTREDLVFLNGYQEKVVGGPLLKLIDTFRNLKVASFEFEKGISEKELTDFFSIVSKLRREKTPVDIKERLKKEGLIHIKPIFLQYIEVEDIPKDVPKPKNIIEGTNHGYKKGRYPREEQEMVDFLKGKTTELPKKINTFLLNHPKLAAMVLLRLIDEYESQNLDSFAAFQAYIQSLSHYMARISRLIKDPDKVQKTLQRLEKHLIVRLKSLDKDRKFVTETKHQIKDALSWVAVEQLLSHYEDARKNLAENEQEIIDAIVKRKVPSIKELKNKLTEIGVYQSKLSVYLNE